MFTKQQMQLMLEMQASINSIIDTNWIETQNRFMLAASQEMSEAIDHYGWKWWKKQTPDLNQVKMEMADIWHFLLSQLFIDMVYEPDSVTLDFILNEEKNLEAFKETFGEVNISDISDIDLMTLLKGSYCLGVINVPLFLTLCNRFGLSHEDLFKLYVGKNVLNEFRQANGYKDGTYIKVWSGREDNEYLTDIMNNVQLDSNNLKEEVYQALTAAYVAYA